ncbi:hypothetical protein Dda_3309 [Drechslerella dactyloides]|uniref:Uncharacterized protein n=1 Tax=Drechslerella dactyloides TaxID=74499 RepID=A0AAD6J127_DREDA|nr:hypothetical protein Dda_3309 [Drechslerella dactyloides]
MVGRQQDGSAAGAGRLALKMPHFFKSAVVAMPEPPGHGVILCDPGNGWRLPRATLGGPGALLSSWFAPGAIHPANVVATPPVADVDVASSNILALSAPSRELNPLSRRLVHRLLARLRARDGIRSLGSCDSQNGSW